MSDDGVTVERAILAEGEVRSGRKLAVTILDEFAHVFAGMAAFYQPSTPKRENKNANVAEFERWSKLACDCAKALAPYQTPTYRAVVVAPAPEAGEKVVRYKLTIFDRELPRLELRREPGDPDSFVVEGAGSEQ